MASIMMCKSGSSSSTDSGSSSNTLVEEAPHMTLKCGSSSSTDSGNSSDTLVEEGPQMTLKCGCPSSTDSGDSSDTLEKAPPMSFEQFEIRMEAAGPVLDEADSALRKRLLAERQAFRDLIRNVTIKTIESYTLPCANYEDELEKKGQAVKAALVGPYQQRREWYRALPEKERSLMKFTLAQAALVEEHAHSE